MAMRNALELDLDRLICFHADGKVGPMYLKNIIDEIYSHHLLDLVGWRRFLGNSQKGDYSQIAKEGQVGFFLQAAAPHGSKSL